MRQISPFEAQAAMETAFHQWGLPDQVRLDNGYPFARTNCREVPTNLALWLVSLGISPIFNRPRCPQENGTVECIQRISSRWARPDHCQTQEQLQQTLDQVSQEHMTLYRIREKGDKTRKELFPDLFVKRRTYDPDLIDPQKVVQYLAQCVFIRKVHPNGRISFAHLSWPIGIKYNQRQVWISFDPDDKKWLAQDEKGKILFQSEKVICTKEQIAALAVISKNDEKIV